MRRPWQPWLAVASLLFMHQCAAITLPVVKLSPTPHSTPLASEKNSILYSNLKPFLQDLMVVSPGTWARAPTITDLENGLSLAYAGIALRVNDRTLLPGRYKVVGHVKELKLPPKPGRRFWSKKNKPDILGMQLAVLGEAVVTDEDGRRRIELTSLTQTILKGDKLIPAEEMPASPAAIIPLEPEVVEPGVVLGSLDSSTYSSQYQIVAITGGLDKQRTVGDLLKIYRHNEEEPAIPLPDYADADLSPEEEASLKKTSPPPPGPDRVAGEALVVRVYDKVSYALVMRSLVAIEKNNKVY